MPLTILQLYRTAPHGASTHHSTCQQDRVAALLIVQRPTWAEVFAEQGWNTVTPPLAVNIGAGALDQVENVAAVKGEKMVNLGFRGVNICRMLNGTDTPKRPPMQRASFASTGLARFPGII